MNQRQRNAWIETAKEQVLQNAETSDGRETDLMEPYDGCVNGLENETRAFCSRHARDNQLIEAQASKLLTGKGYSTQKKSLEGHLRGLEGQRKDSRLALELNTLTAKSQVSRKKQLLANMCHNISRLAGWLETELTGLLEDLIQTNYERRTFDIRSIGGVVWSVSEVDERLLRQMLFYPWSGRQYSKTLWDDTDQLTALAHRELTLGFMSGASMDKIAKGADDVMGKGRCTAQRLVQTEVSYSANQGQLLAYQDAGVIEYRFLGGDCKICQRLNGQMFELPDTCARENLPPIHPNCKCTTVAAYDIPALKQRQGNPLESNPKFEE